MSDPIGEEMLAIARTLVKELEAGNQEAADACIAELTDLRESNLFQELGKLTREFHEAMNSFRFDDRIASFAEDEIPDAKERLNFVIQKTEEAANKTLNAIETVMPVCDDLSGEVGELGDSWSKFTRRELGPDEFRELAKHLRQFFIDSGRNIQEVRNNLNDVLMAQDFQDITGQIIKRVITLVSDVEKSLIELIKLGGKIEPGQKKKQSDPASLDGPQVPGLESDGAVSGQDEVDDLLSSLGF